jgi:5-methylcytosine-specific restriction protein A
MKNIKTKTSSSTSWIFSWNPNNFRLHDYLLDNDTIDWNQGKYKIEIGDVVYIYCSKPEQKICYCLQVIDKDIPYEKTIDDTNYWRRTQNNQSKNEKYCRLKLLSFICSDDLSLGMLSKEGLNNAPQGKQKITRNLLQYIQSCFVNIEKQDPTELSENEQIYEGAKKEVIVNQYERNQMARKQCLEAHGYKCKVCEMTFESRYGEMGKGFIHVHHIVPISAIGTKYKINPENDLIPVCPNCHAMLHKSGLTAEELRQEFLKNL